MRVAFVLAVFLSACAGFGSKAPAEPRPQSILVVQQSDSRGPFPATIFAAFQEAVNGHSSPVSIYVENLDFSRFGGAKYEEALQSYLLTKYEGKPIGVIVAIGAAALRYVINQRDTVWPGAPIVFSMVDQFTFEVMLRPSDVTGSTMRLNFSDMLKAARAIDADLKNIAIVGDSFQHQTAYKHFIWQIPDSTRDLNVIDLMGLPMDDLRKMAADLPPNTVIAYLAVYSDGKGTFYPPVHALALLGETANRPIVVAVETLLNGASVGGYLMIPAAIGQHAARIALRVIGGVPASSIPVAVDDVVRPVFDWRQLQRWNVDISRLPADSDIRNRPITLWDQYRWHISAVAAVFLLLSGLVLVLLHERQSRVSAEIKAHQRMSELVHINRQATAGEMSAAIAHELNQPLGAILNNAETAQMLLATGKPDVSELRDIINDIHRDDQRAGEIIRRLRKLVSKKAEAFEDVDLNDVTREALAIAGIQAHTQGITLHSNLANERLSVNGDAVQLQQVILNLTFNGMEATNDRPKGPRDIVTRTVRADNRTAEFSIYDFGGGIPADKLAHIFDPFFTTKPNGMGMGLSLARTIIEAHNGTIWAENAASGGAIVRFRIPLVRHIMG